VPGGAMVSISVFDTDGIGSNPVLVADVVFWLVAQWKMHRTFNAGVPGPSPGGPTMDE
jgi:hypothetical protein